MNGSDSAGFIVGFLFAVLMFVVGWLIGRQDGIKLMENKAIDDGVAEYYITEERKMDFRWKKMEEEK